MSTVYLNEQTFYPRKWPVFLPLVAGFATLFFMQKDQNTPPSNLYVSLGLGVSALVMWLIFKNISITISEEGIRSKNPFRTREVQWQEVQKVYLKYHHHGKSGSRHIHFELKDLRNVHFSISMFSRQALRGIAEAVVLKCKNAQVEDRLANMAEGVFPWYIL